MARRSHTRARTSTPTASLIPNSCARHGRDRLFAHVIHNLRQPQSCYGTRSADEHQQHHPVLARGVRAGADPDRRAAPPCRATCSRCAPRHRTRPKPERSEKSAREAPRRWRPARRAHHDTTTGPVPQTSPVLGPDHTVSRPRAGRVRHPQDRGSAHSTMTLDLRPRCPMTNSPLEPTIEQCTSTRPSASVFALVSQPQRLAKNAPATSMSRSFASRSPIVARAPSAP